MQDVDLAMWKHLIENGKVFDKFNFYGHSFEVNERKNSEFSRKFLKVGIDWNKTKPVQEEVEDGFEGTFTDSVSRIPTIQGTAVMKDGSKYQLGYVYPSMIDMLRQIVNDIKDGGL